jgi:hypothetical protein
MVRWPRNWADSIIACAYQSGPANHLRPIVTVNRRYFFCAPCRHCEPAPIVASFGADSGRENRPRRVGKPPPVPFFLCTMSRRRTRPSATKASRGAFGAHALADARCLRSPGRRPPTFDDEPMSGQGRLRALLQHCNVETRCPAQDDHPMRAQSAEPLGSVHKSDDSPHRWHTGHACANSRG